MSDSAGAGYGLQGQGGEQASRSVTSTVVQTGSSGTDSFVLRLRLPQEESNRVHWTDDTIDNEHMNKFKSKKCCIFHKPREFDESETESEGTDSESDDEFNAKYPEFASNRKSSGKKRQGCGHGHSHDHGHSHSHGHSHE
mmetsp:Transcript_8297/g.9488  ORF Transcript_8297/g.9488 Transcript_8297/m.9488 type:complete len:140 (-) Transcript_8297:889-1308(-)